MGVWSAFFTPAATCGRPCHVPWVRSSPAQHRATRSLHTGTRCSARALSLRKRTRPGDECVRGRKPNVLSGFGESLYMSLSVFWSFGLLVFWSFGLLVFWSFGTVFRNSLSEWMRGSFGVDAWVGVFRVVFRNSLSEWMRGLESFGTVFRNGCAGPGMDGRVSVFRVVFRNSLSEWMRGLESFGTVFRNGCVSLSELN